jgi:hypothetical protein
MNTPVTSIDQVVASVSGMMKKGAPYVALLVADANGTHWVPVPLTNGVP